MSRRGSKNLTAEERIRIVVDKESTSKTITAIARDIDRAPSTVSYVTYKSLNDREKAAVDRILADLPTRTGMAVCGTIEALERSIAVARENPSPKNIRPLCDALKMLMEIHNLSKDSHFKVNTVDRNPTIEGLAKRAVENLVAKGWKLEHAIEGVSTRFEVPEERVRAQFDC